MNEADRQQPPRLLLIGNDQPEHIGAHLREAARELNIALTFLNVTDANGRWWWNRKFHWWFRGRRPARLKAFSAAVVEECRRRKPRWLLTTGIAPVEQTALHAIGGLGVQRLNYLTDDPWNPAHRAPWFLAALPHYDAVFSPRRANVEELRAAACRQVEYLPFAYAPEVHYPEVGDDEEGAEVVFAGGGDADRAPYIGALRDAGIKVALFGGYWNRYRQTRGLSRGLLPPDRLRRAIAASKIALCLVRRANRDGHVMRTFEIPAIGTCMLTEDTAEHREIFGQDGEAVRYFRTVEEMVERARWLLAHDEERKRLAAAAHRLITGGGHRYQDRLQQMLKVAL
jgi:spore maturation protein CgeB